MKGKSYKQFKRELLKNRKVKESYEKLMPEFEIVEMIIRKRIEKGLTQKELAEKIGTKQSAISRLESGNYNPTLRLLRKVSRAIGAKLEIRLE